MNGPPLLNDVARAWRKSEPIEGAAVVPATWQPFWLGLGPLAGLALLACAVFAWRPQLDIAFARLFYDEAGAFPLDAPLGNLARHATNLVPWVIAVLMMLAFTANRLGLPVPAAPRARSLAFVLLTFALGPGLLVNTALKDHSHRPRPVQVQQFGGKDIFRPFYRFDGACKRNCSFVSGETASAAWTVAPAMLAPLPFRAAATGAALVFSIGVGLLRMGFGGHFLSDVVFAILFTLLVIIVVYRLLYRDRAARSR